MKMFFGFYLSISCALLSSCNTYNAALNNISTKTSHFYINYGKLSTKNGNKYFIVNSSREKHLNTTYILDTGSRRNYVFCVQSEPYCSFQKKASSSPYSVYRSAVLTDIITDQLTISGLAVIPIDVSNHHCGDKIREAALSGILGIDVIDNFVMRLYPKDETTLLLKDSSTEQGDYIEIGRKSDRLFLHLDVEINGKFQKIRAMLDTGSRFGLILSRELAPPNSLSPTVRTCHVGDFSQISFFEKKNLKIGNTDLNDVDVYFASDSIRDTFGFDATIGVQTFQSLTSVTLDSKNGKMWIQK